MAQTLHGMRLVGRCAPFQAAAVAVLACRLCVVRARTTRESSLELELVLWVTEVGGVGGVSHA
jgi:hypothetical protein